ncbi:hypothetical protein D9C73_000377 [Collichthys lucidus]|uniref:Uncharacterized protein n=1 Tax=Collichthys lucidus TaxID=240159 RepID=A0A4U5TZF1_COLLU|nr:hypothetical protein D9C73_000377 [Collichthys lucidus]
MSKNKECFERQDLLLNMCVQFYQGIITPLEILTPYPTGQDYANAAKAAMWSSYPTFCPPDKESTPDFTHAGLFNVYPPSAAVCGSLPVIPVQHATAKEESD